MPGVIKITSIRKKLGGACQPGTETSTTAAALKRAESKPAKRMNGKQGDFEFQACDYLDLVEVGYRPGSDFNCAPGGEFLFEVFSFL